LIAKPYQAAWGGVVGEHFAKLDVHLHQRLLHALHPAGLLGDEHAALTGDRAHGADLGGGSEGCTQQAQAHELLQPLAVLHVTLAARHAFDLTRIHQPHRQSTLLQHLKQRDPVNAGGLQHHSVHATGQQPVGQGLQRVGDDAVLASLRPWQRQRGSVELNSLS